MSKCFDENRPLVGSSGCTYTTLCDYNVGYRGYAFATVITPGFGMQGYDTLTHGCEMGPCTGYFNLDKAYPNYPNNCANLTGRMCGC